jgi:hypothetical protein
MMASENLKRILSFKLTGDNGSRVCGATRIKVDGRGGLTVYDAANGMSEKIDLSQVQSFSIHSLACALSATA